VVQAQIRMLCSDISHMPLLFVWRDSGVAEKHGFQLKVDIANIDLEGQPFVTMSERAPRLLDGTYDFLSGLHHETYFYRARGDKRFVYLAQAQNDWDDRVVASPAVRSVKDLEGQRLVYTADAPCVLGNLKHSLQLGGADLNRIAFIRSDKSDARYCVRALDAVVRGDAVAASVDLPFDKQGEKRGLHPLAIPSVPVIHNATICANREWVVENEETAMAFLRSMIDAIYFFKTEKSKVCAIIERELAPLIGIQGSDEVEHLQEGWAALLSAKPYPHPLAVWNVYNLDIAHNPEVNFIGPFDLWDTSYLRALDDSGYIDALYGGAQQAGNPPVNAAI
jgi:ABC-type nitrate/sulfonate/bicarbonate transport system substrate-binding protein